VRTFFYVFSLKYFIYILYSEKCDCYYKGQTKNLQDRIERHNKGYEKSTARYRPWKLIWSTAKLTRSEAISLERKLKNLSNERLKEFISKYS
jgi:putative endonuclease